jgi:hypothetical protein
MFGPNPWSEANKILLSTPAQVLWKFAIVCAFSGIFRDFPQKLRAFP